MKYIKTERALNVWCIYHDDSGEFEACLVAFDEPSQFGINGGKISKLTITRRCNRKILCNYDRGFDVQPAEEVKAFYNEIIKALN